MIKESNYPRHGGNIPSCTLLAFSPASVQQLFRSLQAIGHLKAMDEGNNIR